MLGVGVLPSTGPIQAGRTGSFTVVTFTFNVVAAGTSPLDLSYSAMAAATSFANLLSPNILTITDGSVTVGGGVNHTVTFNSNGGTGTMSAQTANVPTALTANTYAGGLHVQRLEHGCWRRGHRLTLTARPTLSRQTSRCMPSGRRWRTTR